MQRRDAYPPDTAIGACFITGDYDPSEGVVDLEMWTDDLADYGRLCVSPKAVGMMMACLGMVAPPENVAERNRELIEENRKLKMKLSRMTKAVNAVLDAGYLSRLEPLAEDWEPPVEELVP